MVMIRSWCKSRGEHAPEHWNNDPGPRLEDGEMDSE
jgi:hypothetical protein